MKSRLKSSCTPKRGVAMKKNAYIPLAASKTRAKKNIKAPNTLPTKFFESGGQKSSTKK